MEKISKKYKNISLDIYLFPKSKYLSLFLPGLPFNRVRDEFINFCQENHISFACLFYSGSFGNKNKFSPLNWLEDVESAYNFLRDFISTEFEKSNAPELISMGNSLGASMGLCFKSLYNKPKKLIAFSPVIDFRTQFNKETASSFVKFLKEKYNDKYFLDEKKLLSFLKGNNKRLNPIDIIKKPIECLIIFGEKDLVLTPDQFKKAINISKNIISVKTGDHHINTLINKKFVSKKIVYFLEQKV